jgi:streptogramin lyase
MGNSVMRVDANTLKVTEFRLPLKNGNPYAVYVDKEDNVWLENAVYNSFVKFDPKTQKFTYFPFPELSSHTPNMEMDSEGTVWFGMGEPSQLTGLKLNGNVPLRKTASR